MNRFNAFESLESRLFLSGTQTGETHAAVNTSEIAVVMVPTAPSRLTDTVKGQTVTLKWTDNSINETGFDVQRYVGHTLTDLAQVGANVTTFTDSTAPVGNVYYLVRAFNAAGQSEGTNIVAMTIAAPAQVLTVIAPKKLGISAVSTTQLSINWQGDAGATGGYTIQRSTDGKTGWTTAGTAGAGVRTFVDSKLTAKTKYFYRIVALGGDGASATSGVIYGLTKATDGGDSKTTKK
jgi:hypothetical protein